ncbi:unnamed protein product [Triticum turgidum subsp. durum]|uniref:Uncharacterized protein n=1 Tax=Triticum turgidum subsp. durum TaxID=4567 RepID=A0A9R1R3J2_TRITD|nr:unnamed protein product [Triticum turgidum subsp. durum]
MSTMAMSALNPDAPMFIPAAFKKVEDYSPEWWELVKTTAWFRDHWFRQHQLYEDLADDVDVDDVAALLPDDSVDLLDADDLFYSPPSPQPQPDFYHYKPAAWAPMRHAEKPAQHVGPRAGGGARRAIHQPR